MMMSKRINIIAGPNGAGKTTMALSLMSEKKVIDEFINADEIARGLAPLNPGSVSLTASKLMLKRFQDLILANKTFAFETTASGTNYIKHLKEAQKRGYEVHLTFLWLSSPDLAIERVLQRVIQGGHYIPEETVERRYFAGLKNLIKYYIPQVDRALILDNSNGENKVIARKSLKGNIKIEDQVIWMEIERFTNVTIE